MASQQPTHTPIAKQIRPQVTTTLPKRKQELTPLVQFQQAFLQIHDKRRSSKNGYEKVIAALEQMVEELIVKNDNLTH